MTDERRSDVDPDAEEAPPRSREEVAGKGPPDQQGQGVEGAPAGPTLGRAGDMTSDDESLARRPAQDRDEIDGDTESDNTGTPPGSATHGA